MNIPQQFKFKIIFPLELLYTPTYIYLPTYQNTVC